MSLKDSAPKVKYSLLIAAAGVASSIIANKSGYNTPALQKVDTLAIIGGVTSASCFYLDKNHPIIATLVGVVGIGVLLMTFAIIEFQ